MPPRRRTTQSKRTPSTSPTSSTFHASADQPHHLRHTGPSISTRPGITAAPSKPPQPALTSESPLTQQGQIREERPLAEVSSAGACTPFTKFMYALLFLALLLLGWYVYGMMNLLEGLKDEVGWWNIVTGDSARITWWENLKGRGFDGSDWSGRAEAEKGSGLEGSLNALADALGISPVQVAYAVKPLIPQASLTNIALKTGATGGSEAVRILFEDTTRDSRSEAGIPGRNVEGFVEWLRQGVDEGDVVEGGMSD